jgi:hypothetical protein
VNYLKNNQESNLIYNNYKNNSIIEINLTKEAEDLYNESHNTQIKGKISHVHGWQELIL